MPFNNSGIYSRVDGTRTVWEDDATNNVRIEADLHDNHDNDIGDALSQTIMKDGHSIITENIPFNNKKITNLGNGTPGSTDAANMSQLAALKEFSTGIIITGADANGRITFQGAGVNGLAWVAQDISWIARSYKAGEALNRVALNQSANPSLTVPYGDVFDINESGYVNFGGHLMSNGAYDGQWRTIVPGTMTLARLNNGSLDLFSNQTATITNNYAVAALRQFFGVTGVGGNTQISMAASSSGNQNQIVGSHVGVTRWNMRLGNDEGLGGGNTGAAFDLLAYDDAGAYRQQVLRIARNTGEATFNGRIVGNAGVLATTLSATSTIAAGATVTAPNFYASNAIYFGDASSVGLAVNGANGVVVLRPSRDNLNTELKVEANGTLLVCNGVEDPTGGTRLGLGLRSRTGQSGAALYGDEWMNLNWNGSQTAIYAGNTVVGVVPSACDYRIKRAIQPLASTWEAVKSLNPISYKQKAFGDDGVIKDREEIQWGFIAHEVQQGLVASAAYGEKDGPDIQHPNLLAIIAGLTKALQEAMTRIEALEAAA